MTIAVSVKVNDGLVLAADSASTLVTRDDSGKPAVVNVYNNANKIFNVYKGLPVGLITWGSGSIGDASISTLAKDLRDRLSGADAERSDWKLEPERYTVQQVADRVKEFMFDERYAPQSDRWPEQPALGFVVAGYSAGEGLAEEYRIDIGNGSCAGPELVRRKDDSGLAWNGEPEAISRLVCGVSGSLRQVLEGNLGVPAGQSAAAVATIQQALAAPLVVPAMPLQDAIDLARFLVDVTIQWSRFNPGPPTVAGPIEIAAISKHEHFKWIQRKYYYSRELNPEGQT